MQIKLEQFECQSLLGRLLLCFNNKLPKIKDSHDAVRHVPLDHVPQPTLAYATDNELGAFADDFGDDEDEMAPDLHGQTAVIQTDEALFQPKDPSRARNRLTHSRLIALQSYLSEDHVSR